LLLCGADGLPLNRNWRVRLDRKDDIHVVRYGGTPPCLSHALCIFRDFLLLVRIHLICRIRQRKPHLAQPRHRLQHRLRLRIRTNLGPSHSHMHPVFRRTGLPHFVHDTDTSNIFSDGRHQRQRVAHYGSRSTLTQHVSSSEPPLPRGPATGRRYLKGNNSFRLIFISVS
jgi:hypothetical protein